MRRPALIFDFGNVIAFFDYARACDRLAAPLGIGGLELLERVRALGFSEQVKLYESGKLAAEEFSKSVCDLAGLSVGHEAFAAAWSDIFTLNKPVARLVAGLKERGYTLVLGSNTNDLHAAQFRHQFAEALRPFDRLVLSYEVGHIKPSAEFYRACVEAAGAPAGDCVFIDDLAENVEGARSAGLLGVVYSGDAALRADLSALGVDLPPA